MISNIKRLFRIKAALALLKYTSQHLVLNGYVFLFSITVFLLPFGVFKWYFIKKKWCLSVQMKIKAFKN